MISDEKNDCINYRIKGTREPIGDWGHEYVRFVVFFYLSININLININLNIKIYFY